AHPAAHRHRVVAAASISERMTDMRVDTARLCAATVLLAGMVGGCAAKAAPDERRPPPSPLMSAPSTARATATGPSVRVAAAGDIASSPTSGGGTAHLVESLHPDWVVTLGDNAYEKGTIAEF